MKKICFVFIALIVSIISLVSMGINNQVVLAENIKGLSAKSYVVMDSNGKILNACNPHEKKEVASICKLMTTFLTLEEIEKGNISLDDKVVASSYACDAEGSQAFLDAGSDYSIRDLLKSVIVASANDSAIVLAETISGTENNFVEKMNAKAEEIGMKNTLYANSTGLHVENEQFSTAYDTAIILNKISDFSIYQEDCKIWMDKLIHPSGRETELVNTNRLIKYYPHCVTGKTGFTDEAGYCLSSTAIKDNLKLTCVVLGCDTASDRFTDSVALYNNAYANFKSEKVVDKNIPVENSIKVMQGKVDSISVVPNDDYYLTLSKQDKNDYDIVYEINETIKAPINVGYVVGVAKIIVDGEVVDEVSLISNSNIEKQSYKDILKKIAEKFQFLN